MMWLNPAHGWRFCTIIGSIIGIVASQPLDQIVLDPDSDAPTLEYVRKELIKAKIIPNIIENFTPRFYLSVEWANGTSATLGNIIKSSRLEDEPSFSLHEPDTGHPIGSPILATVAMTDPDAPSAEDRKWSEFCHWIVSRVSQKHKDGQQNDKTVIPYKPPAPPKGTGFHRYILIAFKPEDEHHHKLPQKPEDRKRWGKHKIGSGVKNWAHENQLVPIAANFFYVQHE